MTRPSSDDFGRSFAAFVKVSGLFILPEDGGVDCFVGEINRDGRFQMRAGVNQTAR